MFLQKLEQWDPSGLSIKRASRLGVWLGSGRCVIDSGCFLFETGRFCKKRSRIELFLIQVSQSFFFAVFRFQKQTGPLVKKSRTQVDRYVIWFTSGRPVGNRGQAFSLTHARFILAIPRWLCINLKTFTTPFCFSRASWLRRHGFIALFSLLTKITRFNLYSSENFWYPNGTNSFSEKRHFKSVFF